MQIGYQILPRPFIPKQYPPTSTLPNWSRPQEAKAAPWRAGNIKSVNLYVYFVCGRKMEGERGGSSLICCEKFQGNCRNLWCYFPFLFLLYYYSFLFSLMISLPYEFLVKLIIMTYVLSSRGKVFLVKHTSNFLFRLNSSFCWGRRGHISPCTSVYSDSGTPDFSRKWTSKPFKSSPSASQRSWCRSDGPAWKFLIRQNLVVQVWLAGGAASIRRAVNRRLE